MVQGRLPTIGFIWAQFAPYHVDRIEAVAERLAGKAQVLAVEVATTSSTYDWAPSGDVDKAIKLTLFPSGNYDKVGSFYRFWAQFNALRRCKTVFLGIGYDRIDMLATAWLLRLTGRQVVMMSDSKFDDRRRSVSWEMLKSLALLCYSAALVAGQRQIAYFRFLGFCRRRIVGGYDTVSVRRIRSLSQHVGPTAFAQRDFVFVGRFVAKKNLFRMLEGYARYVSLSPDTARRLHMVGSGPQEAELRATVHKLGLADKVVFHGFRGPQEIAALLAESLALLLVSSEEQWGLVVNEAVAAGLPAIVSSAVGARDLLVRAGVNGAVVEPGSIASIAAAMRKIAENEACWHAMAASSVERAWFADVERFADSVEDLIARGEDGEVHARVERVLAELQESDLV